MQNDNSRNSQAIQRFVDNYKVREVSDPIISFDQSDHYLINYDNNSSLIIDTETFSNLTEDLKDKHYSSSSYSIIPGNNPKFYIEPNPDGVGINGTININDQMVYDLESGKFYEACHGTIQEIVNDDVISSCEVSLQSSRYQTSYPYFTDPNPSNHPQQSLLNPQYYYSSSNFAQNQISALTSYPSYYPNYQAGYYPYQALSYFPDLPIKCDYQQAFTQYVDPNYVMASQVLPYFSQNQLLPNSSSVNGYSPLGNIANQFFATSSNSPRPNYCESLGNNEIKFTRESQESWNAELRADPSRGFNPRGATNLSIPALSVQRAYV